MTTEYGDREIETISREDLTRLQVERLRETVGIALQSPFYSKRGIFSGCGPVGRIYVYVGGAIVFEIIMQKKGTRC